MLFAQFIKDPEEYGDDEVLWGSLQDGQREALSELFQRHHTHLYNYGIKITPNSAIVNEAIQELFLNLWNSHKHLSAANSVKAYLLSSLRRIILKRIQQDKNRAKRNRNYIEDQDEQVFPIEDLFISREIARQKREQLQKGLETLTPRQKEAVFLKFYHGLTNQELVDVMEINYQCIRNLLYNALERLRSTLESVSSQD